MMQTEYRCRVCNKLLTIESFVEGNAKLIRIDGIKGGDDLALCESHYERFKQNDQAA
jgi:hypothetical protein